MGVRVGSSWSSTPLNTLPASNAETLLFTTPLLVTATDYNAVFLHWFLAYTTATGTTGVVVNIRRGASLSSPVVPTSPWTATANGLTGYFWGGCYFDTLGPGLVAYSLTLTLQGTISVISTITDGGLYAYML